MKKRDIGQEILEGIRAIKKGEGKRINIDKDLFVELTKSLSEASAISHKELKPSRTFHIEENKALSLFAKKREKTFNKSKALKHKEVW